jgi:hypothetical protein
VICDDISLILDETVIELWLGRRGLVCGNRVYTTRRWRWLRSGEAMVLHVNIPCTLNLFLN